jgi:hypothetical protein
MVKTMANDGSSSTTKQMDNSDSEFGDVTASNLLISPGSSVIPKLSGQLAFEVTNNTTLTLKVKGTDGVVRSATLNLS